MQIIRTAEEIRETLQAVKKNGVSIGFVPTMGFLHSAHLSLINRSLPENDLTVVSIYVNPTQFGPGEDFEDYPRDLAQDQKLLQEAGVDFLFAPQDNEQIYPQGQKNIIPPLPEFCQEFEGARPGNFFQGVCQVVSRLFDLIPADRAYFGQKDYQQLLTMRWLTNTLNYPIDIVGCPIGRESDGLAISSRNIYLNTPDKRQAATVLNKTLKKVQSLILSGENEVVKLEQIMQDLILAEPEVERINYLGIRAAQNLAQIDTITEEAVGLLGVRIGGANLIDNMIFQAQSSKLKCQN